MKMSELIARYGDDKIQFQNLDDCADTLNMGKKGITKITLGTEQPVTLRGTDKLGLVLWFDRKVVAEIVAANKAATVSEGEEQGSAHSGEDPPSSPSRERVEVRDQVIDQCEQIAGQVDRQFCSGDGYVTGGPAAIVATICGAIRALKAPSDG